MTCLTKAASLVASEVEKWPWIWGSSTCARLYAESSIDDDFDNFRGVTDEPKQGPIDPILIVAGQLPSPLWLPRLYPPRCTNWVLLSKNDVIHRRAQSLIPNVWCIRSMRINYGYRQCRTRHWDLRILEVWPSPCRLLCKHQTTHVRTTDRSPGFCDMRTELQVIQIGIFHHLMMCSALQRFR